MTSKNVKLDAFVKKIKTALKSDNKLVVYTDKFKGILGWGKKNNFPEYLLHLYKNQPQHQGIVNGKTDYLCGLGIKASTPQAQAWLQKANPLESWQDLRQKYNKDKNIFGGFAIKVIPNLLGVPIHFYHVDFGKLRVSNCYEKVKYSDDWSDYPRIPIQDFPIWKPGCCEPSIFIYKDYSPTVRKIESAYPPVEYGAAILDIDTDIRVSNFFNSLVINGFSSQAIVTLYSGKPQTEDERNYLADRIKGEHSGDETAGNTVFLFADPGDKAADVQTLSVTDLDKQFQEVTKRNQKNIYSAHNAPPELFNYISDQSTVFDVSKIVEQNELFMNTWVIPNQKNELKMMSMFCQIRTGVVSDFDIEQFEPVGLDLPLDNQNVVEAINTKDPNIIFNYLNKKYKLGVQETPIQTPQPGQVPIKQAETNDHLKNLTAQQSMNIDRVVRKFNKGTYSEAQATILLKSYGLTDSEIKQFLGINQPSAGQLPIKQRMEFAKRQQWFEIFDKVAHKIQDEDTLFETKFVDVPSNDDAVKNAVINQITNNPDATPEEISKAIGVAETIVASTIAWLIAKKLIEKTSTGFLPKIDYSVQFYTEYTYSLRPDIQGPVLLPTTRDWCRMMYHKHHSEKKALTLDAIDQMTNDFGMNAFDYRGGFYTVKGTNETTPWCRHGWFAHVKSRKIKK